MGGMRRWGVWAATGTILAMTPGAGMAAQESAKPATAQTAKSTNALPSKAERKPAATAAGKSDRSAQQIELLGIARDPKRAPRERFDAWLLYAAACGAKQYRSAVAAYANALGLAEGPAERAEIRLRMATAAAAARVRQEEVAACLEPLLPDLDRLMPDAQRAVLGKLAAAYDAGGRRAEALKFTELLLTRNLLDTSADVLGVQGDVAALQGRLGAMDKAMDTMRKALGAAADVDPAVVAATAAKTARQWAAAGHLDGANVLLKMGLQAVSNAPVQATFALHNAMAVVLATNPATLGEAEREYRIVVDAVKSMDSSNVAPATAVIEACDGLAAIYAAAKQEDRLCETLLVALRLRCADAKAVAAVKARLLAAASDSRQYLEQAVSVFRENVVRMGGSGPAADAAQQGVVEFLAKLGRDAEAMQEARVLFHACAAASLPQTADLLVGLFKAADGNLARANRLLKYQRFGPAGIDGALGTEDDLQDVLAELPPFKDPKRAELYATAARRQPEDWQGYRRRASFHLYLDQPVQAFEALRKSFSLCPPSDVELQRAADDLTGLVVRLTKDKVLGESLVQFMMYGAEGEDGKKGTADDLSDPSPEIVKRLGAGQPQAVGELH